MHQVVCSLRPAWETVCGVTLQDSFVLGSPGQDGTYHPLQSCFCGNLPKKGNIVTSLLFSRMFPSENNTTTLAKEELRALLDGRRNRLIKGRLCGWWRDVFWNDLFQDRPQAVGNSSFSGSRTRDESNKAFSVSGQKQTEGQPRSPGTGHPQGNFARNIFSFSYQRQTKPGQVILDLWVRNGLTFWTQISLISVHELLHTVLLL